MLQIKNVSKTYGTKKAVDNFSLHVCPGELYGIIGHNGAGKTTLIRMITGILDMDKDTKPKKTAPTGAGEGSADMATAEAPESGKSEITINGHSISKEPIECKRIMAYIPDNPDLYENMTAIQYLNFVADVYDVSEKDREERINSYADRFEIANVLTDQIASFSHGMKQKVAIISALIHEPKLLILDEPFVGLDPKAAFTLKAIMREMCEKGNSIFFSTHVLEVAEKICDKIAIIKGGKLIAAGNTEEIIGTHSLEEVFMEVANEEK